jgi:chemotaxis response regulator CheB
MSADRTAIRVLTVDDHFLCAGVAAILASQPDMTLVTEASNGRETIRVAEPVLVDWRLAFRDAV